MKLYIKQKVFSLKDRFYIYDEFEREQYYVEGEFFTLGHKLHLYRNGMEVAYIQQKVWSFLSRYFVFKNDVQRMEVEKQLTLFRSEYEVIPHNWTMNGDFWSHEYTITGADGLNLATISKKWFSWADTYEIDINSVDDQVIEDVLSLVIIMDCVNADAAASAAATTNASN